MRLVRYIPVTLSGIAVAIVLMAVGTRVPGMAGHPGLLVVVSLALLALGLVVDAARIRQRPFEFRAFAPLEPDEVLDRADVWFEAAGWELRDGLDDRVVAQREPALSVPTLALLLVAGVIPGLIYLFIARRAESVTMTVTAVPVEGGATVELIGSGLSSEALAFFRGLHGSSRGRRAKPVAGRAGEPTT